MAYKMKIFVKSPGAHTHTHIEPRMKMMDQCATGMGQQTTEDEAQKKKTNFQMGVKTAPFPM